MAERMFGVETEYAFTALDRDGARIGEAAGALVELAHATLEGIPDFASQGLYLRNGARFYLDCGGHPEMTTPECTDPWSLVRYVRAGDRIVALLAEELRRGDPRITEVLVTRCNVDYGGTGSTWGAHESYLHRADPRQLSRQIIPHLVSRIVFTGAGGFDNRFGGVRFLLSPRVPHLVRVSSGESMHTRGIFHTKEEPLCDGGYRRLHVLCGETLCSDAASWLRVGTTALVVCLAEAGVDVGRSVQLTAPIGALRAFAADPACRATAAVAGPRSLRAIDIQRHYLEEVERRLGEPYLPEWAEAVCTRWRATLERLERGPEAVATELDWAIKLALFRRHAERRGVDWDGLSTWNEAVRRLGVCVQPTPPAPVDLWDEPFGLSRVRARPPAPAAAPAPAPEKTAPPGSARRRAEVLAFAATARELFEIDTRFAQLGEGGLFAALERARLLQHRIEGLGDVEAAVSTPPERGRAKVRAAAIAELAGRSGCASADWQSVRDFTGSRWLDLSDPFAEEVAWQPEASPRRPLAARATARALEAAESSLRARIAALLALERR